MGGMGMGGMSMPASAPASTEGTPSAGADGTGGASGGMMMVPMATPMGMMMMPMSADQAQQMQAMQQQGQQQDMTMVAPEAGTMYGPASKAGQSRASPYGGGMMGGKGFGGGGNNTAVPCKYGNNCKRPGCWYMHPCGFAPAGPATGKAFVPQRGGLGGMGMQVGGKEPCQDFRR